MSKKIMFTCVLTNGVHARPASHIEQVCKQFESSIMWHNMRSNIKVDAKSVLSLISSNTLKDDECYLMIDGHDEERAFIRLKIFIEDEFPICDEQLKLNESYHYDVSLPRSLSNLNPQFIQGKSICKGIAHGILQLINDIDIDVMVQFPTLNTTQNDNQLIKIAIERLKEKIAIQMEHVQDCAKDILTAHLAILDDSAFSEQIETFIHHGDCAGAAIVNTAKFFRQQLALSGSDYLKERELDIRDIALQLLQQIYGDQLFPSQKALTSPTICIAKELTPSQFLQLDKQYLKGLVLQASSSTSHTAILANAYNIPTLVAVNIKSLEQYQGDKVQIDGNLGLVVFNLTPAITRYYQMESQLQATTIEPGNLTNTTGDTHVEMPLLSQPSISLNPQWQSKEEVIKGMTDKLSIIGRCHNPRKLEEDIWLREDIFSTALGHGFAIPHTKSEHIEHSTISVTKLADDIKWGDEEVNFIIMLTLNKSLSGDQHMRIFSKLARKIMHNEFRSQLQNATSQYELQQILTRELEL